MDPATREVTEVAGAGPVPGLTHPDWRSRWPWLIQGVTVPGPHRAWDMALFGSSPAGSVLDRWEVLLASVPVHGAAHSRQVHGAAVRWHDSPSPGLRIAPPGDGHVTAAPGLLLAVSVADCVPILLVAPERRVVGAVHAGWRGAAAGILEATLSLLAERVDVEPRDLHIHMGPSICGRCYEVGPEVHAALGEPVPPAATAVDLPGNLARRALALGVPGEQVTRSSFCTRCGPVGLFSHRGGDAGRQVGFIGLAFSP